MGQGSHAWKYTNPTWLLDFQLTLGSQPPLPLMPETLQITYPNMLNRCSRHNWLAEKCCGSIQRWALRSNGDHMHVQTSVFGIQHNTSFSGIRMVPTSTTNPTARSMLSPSCPWTPMLRASSRLIRMPHFRPTQNSTRRHGAGWWVWEVGSTSPLSIIWDVRINTV